MTKFWGPTVTWAGVVVMHDDGSQYAVEFDGRSQRITWELTIEQEFDETLGSKLGFSPWREYERTDRRTYDIHIRAIGEATKAIEADADGSQ